LDGELLDGGLVGLPPVPVPYLQQQPQQSAVMDLDLLMM